MRFTTTGAASAPNPIMGAERISEAIRRVPERKTLGMVCTAGGGGNPDEEAVPPSVRATPQGHPRDARDERREGLRLARS